MFWNKAKGPRQVGEIVSAFTDITTELDLRIAEDERESEALREKIKQANEEIAARIDSRHKAIRIKSRIADLLG
ncbi:MAG: hypothetical protein [Caudoviricetes sp.]|nr:MAG: hypothetical protein [Caudoviricetes sp.]